MHRSDVGHQPVNVLDFTFVVLTRLRLKGMKAWEVSGCDCTTGAQEVSLLQFQQEACRCLYLVACSVIQLHLRDFLDLINTAILSHRPLVLHCSDVLVTGWECVCSALFTPGT